MVSFIDILLVVTGTLCSPCESPVEIRLQAEPELVENITQAHCCGVHNGCSLLQATKQGTQQFETGSGCEETQKESIRSGPEFVVANGVMLAREKETKLTSPGGYNCNVNGQVYPRDIQSMLNPSLLHNGNEVDDWMGLDEWNSWFKSQARYSNRSQDIVNLNKTRHFRIRSYGTQSKNSLTRWYSLVVEHSTAHREVSGSNPGAPFFWEVEENVF
ncbi:hypothetical protein TNCV_978411 [Trichonephila clavipes]|nr:hypothetical protein TNCV_978411 [Trichonephila clavipes]